MRKLALVVLIVVVFAAALLAAAALSLNRIIARNHDRILQQAVAALGRQSPSTPSRSASGAGSASS